MQKRFYILFVARGDDGQLRKISIPVHYLYVFVVGAAIGFLSLTGIASSYTRMLLKVSRYNELRTEKDQLKDNYSRLEQVAKERDVQVASLGSIAGEVSALYGLKAQPTLVTATSEQIQDADVSSSLDQLHALRTSALTGATMVGLTMGLTRNATTADWFKANSAPNLWPVEGQVTGSFGERIDPFNGEGAFHSGVDIGSSYGAPIIAPADGSGHVQRPAGRLRQGDHDRSRQRHQHPLRPSFRLRRHGRAVGPSRRRDWLCRRERTLHRAASSLRSPHQRHSGQSLQVPPHDRRPQRRLRCGKLDLSFQPSGFYRY